MPPPEVAWLSPTPTRRTARPGATAVWQQLAGLFGYRVRPEAGATLDTVVTLIDATMHGMVMMALATPGMATHRTTAAPFGAAAPEEWSLPALGIAGIAAAFLEPDPAVEWDGERLAQVRQALTEVTPPGSITTLGHPQPRPPGHCPVTDEPISITTGGDPRPRNRAQRSLQAPP